MPISKPKVVKCLAEFVCEIERLIALMSGDKRIAGWGAWYRGHANESWPLLPSIYRSDSAIIPNREREAVRDFRLNASPLLDGSPVDAAEWLFIMQHYSMPTRLLDWTESNLAALYFATCTGNTEENGCVWTMSPITLNDPVLKQPYKQRTVPTSDHTVMSKYLLDNSDGAINRTFKAKYPLAVRPARKSPRIVAQKGTFTIHGKEPYDLAKLKSSEGYAHFWIEKICVDGPSKARIASELYRSGITAYTIYRDLDHLSEEIKFRYSKKYSIAYKPKSNFNRNTKHRSNLTLNLMVAPGQSHNLTHLSSIPPLRPRDATPRRKR